MRTFSCLALVLALAACEQTDPSAARNAGGAAGAAVDEAATPQEAVEGVTEKAVEPAPAGAAVTGFNTGKRLFKPTSFASEGAPSEASSPTPAVSPRDVDTGLANGRRTYKPDF